MGQVGQAVAAPFDSRYPHQFDSNNYCVQCHTYKHQLGNKYSCSGGGRKTFSAGYSTQSGPYANIR